MCKWMCMWMEGQQQQQKPKWAERTELGLDEAKA